MTLFTGAVLAIAIKLLIIEIKAQEIHGNMTFAETVGQLLKLTPKFIGIMIGFFIATYWHSRHRMFSFIKNYDDKLIWVNFFFQINILGST